MLNFRVRAKPNKRAEVLLYDEIGETWGGGISAKQFAEELKALGSIDTINLRVNSPGGNVFDAVAMYNTLRAHPAKIEVDIDGMALSAATLVVMAGEMIRMAENAMFMIHDPWSVAIGNAEVMRKQADMLDDVKGTIVTTYHRRTKANVVEIERMMSEETWMRASVAREHGFIDEITEALEIAAHFDPTRFKNVPPELRRQQDRQDAEPKRLNMARAKIRDQAKRAAAAA